MSNRPNFGLQTIPSCCCPDCMVNTPCCKCTCRRLCVVFTPANEVDEDYRECSITSIELDWEDGIAGWEGALNDLDLRYYFERTDEGCFFKLRSVALGYPIAAARGIAVYAWDDCNNSASETPCSVARCLLLR